MMKPAAKSLADRVGDVVFYAVSGSLGLSTAVGLV
jgi:hypothetical protein